MKFFHPILFIILLCLTFALLYLYWYRGSGVNINNEGFQQERAFVSKVGSDIYDSFYTEIYDDLMLSERRSEDLFDAIIHVSQPTTRYSSFLDVGSGTGAMIERLLGAGYNATGIELSSDMVAFCQQKSLNNFIVGDVLDSMKFDRGQFSHIICAGMTLYEWNESEVLRFFRNSYFWTIAGGYLFVHLVDPLQFSAVPLAAVSEYDLRERQRQRGRIVNSEIDFLDFAYKSVYDFSDVKESDGHVRGSCGCATHRESFIDAKTQHVRENEIILYMYSVDTIVSLALRSGFIVKAKWNLLDSPYSDAHQYIYMFERTL
jgi:SAM-dependent methyltransferase